MMKREKRTKVDSNGFGWNMSTHRFQMLSDFLDYRGFGFDLPVESEHRFCHLVSSFRVVPLQSSSGRIVLKYNDLKEERKEEDKGWAIKGEWGDLRRKSYKTSFIIHLFIKSLQNNKFTRWSSSQAPINVENVTSWRTIKLKDSFVSLRLC